MGSLLTLLLGLVACGSLAAEVVPGQIDLAITCHVAYRSGVGESIGREESLVLDAPGAASQATFDDMALHALYNVGEGEGGRALALRVQRDATEELIAAQLYQLPAGAAPRNEFVGGHGFTGLTYAYHPASGAELQYWCVAGREP